MYRTESMDSLEAEVDALQMELQRKEKDLIQAARYGKSLLEENMRLKEEIQALMDERGRLQEMLQSQKTDALHMQSEIGRTAEAHMADLEEQLDNVEQSLAHERAAAVQAKEKYRSTVKDLEVEIARLQDTLVQEAQHREREVTLQIELKNKLQTCEEKKQELMLEISTLSTQLNELQETNKVASEHISTLTHTCDVLANEIQSEKEEAEFWEKRCFAKDAEVKAQFKELSDCQALVKHLQLQLSQQYTQTIMALTPNSMLSRGSLFDELSMSDSLSCQGAPCTEDVSEVLGEYLERSCGHSEVSSETLTERETHTQAWVEDHLCSRCQELSEELQEHRKQLDVLNSELLMVVQQKFSLQQQNAAWQDDMATVVQKQVSEQLERDLAKRRQKEDTPLAEKRPTKFTFFHS